MLNHVLKYCNENIPINENTIFCNACHLGKSHLLLFKLSTSTTSTPLELIHSDLWGPSLASSTLGFTCYISFVYDHIRLTHILPLKRKFEALKAFVQYQKLVENRFENKIKILQSEQRESLGLLFLYLKMKELNFGILVPILVNKMGRPRENIDTL